MFGLGFSELLIIMVIALIVIGPEKLPGIAKAMGKGYAEFRKTLDDVQKGVYESAQPKEESAYLNQLLKEREEEKAKKEAETPPATAAGEFVYPESANAEAPSEEAPSEEAAAISEMVAESSETHLDASKAPAAEDSEEEKEKGSEPATGKDGAA